MKQVVFHIDDEVLADFDICARAAHRTRTGHFREIIMAEIKRVHRKYPDNFKEQVK